MEDLCEEVAELNPTETEMLLLLVFFLPLFLVFLSIRQATSKKGIYLLPSPLKLPIIGNLHQLGSTPHRSLHALAKKHGPLMLLHLGQVPTVIVSSAEMAREITKTYDTTFASRPLLKAAHILFYGSIDLGFAPYGEHWKQMRKICVTNLLSGKMVQSFRSVREEEVALLIERIFRATSTQGPVDVSQSLFFFTNDMICRVILGEKSIRDEGRNKLFRNIVREMFTLVGAYPVEDCIPSLGWFDAISGFNHRAKKIASKWDAVLNKIIEEHIHRMEEDKCKNDDFVDVLLSLQKDPDMKYSLTKDHIKALLMDMISGGADTSYIVVEWSLAELMKNPEVMKKLKDEIRTTVRGKSMVREEDLSEMSYLRAVLKEVLRLHPPAPLFPRESVDSCQIEGYEIPKQTRVIINTYAIARDPKYWNAPEKFQPERFLGNSIDFQGHDSQYLPFGAGRRICPGMRFAACVSELALANLVYGFDWELPDGMVREELDMTEASGLTVGMKKGLHLVPKPYIK